MPQATAATQRAAMSAHRTRLARSCGRTGLGCECAPGQISVCLAMCALRPKYRLSRDSRWRPLCGRHAYSRSSRRNRDLESRSESRCRRWYGRVTRFRWRSQIRDFRPGDQRAVELGQRVRSRQPAQIGWVFLQISWPCRRRRKWARITASMRRGRRSRTASCTLRYVVA